MKRPSEPLHSIFISLVLGVERVYQMISLEFSLKLLVRGVPLKFNKRTPVVVFTIFSFLKSLLRSC